MAGNNPLLALEERRLALYLGFGAFAAAAIQLALGASLAIVAMALIATAFGLFGFVILGGYNLGSWTALFYALGNVLVALYAKTILAQPLDSHLYTPLDSFLALTVTSGALFAALLLVRWLPVGRPIFKPVRRPDFLGFFSWACFGLGVVFWLLNRKFQNPGGTGFGGVALFRNLLFMAVIARTAMLLEHSEHRRTLDARLAFVIAGGVFLGLLDDSKTMAALPVVSYFATVLFYRRGLPARSITLLAVGIIVFVGVIAPMTHALRAMGQQKLGMSQRIELVASNYATLLQAPEHLSKYDRLAALQFQQGYYNYFGKNGGGQMLLGRYASVQQIDPVIAEVNRQGAWGGSAVWPALARLVPSFIYPGKPKHVESFNTLVHYGLIEPQGGKFPTLPLAGQAYAAYGWWGLLTLPFITFLGFLIAVKKLGWNLYRNIYGIFFLCDFVIVYANQGDFGQYAGAALRNFPLFALIFWLISQSFRIRVRDRRRRNVGLFSRIQQSLLGRPAIATDQDNR